MALYERIKAEFLDINGINGRDYTIRLYKDVAIQPQDSVTLDASSEGFIHEYYGGNEELWDFIKYSKVTIPFIISNATDKGVTDEVIEGIEGQWYCKITHTSDASIYFQGIVLIDQAEYENTSYPYRLNITCSDGLSLLQNKKITSVEDYFDAPFNLWFYKVLNQFSFDELGGFTLYTSFRDWNELMLLSDSASETRDPLAYMFVELDELFFTNNKNGRDFYTHGELLNQLCNFLHCNLFYSQGAYYLVSLYERNKDTLYVTEYGDSFAFDSTYANSYSIEGWSQDTEFPHTISLFTNNIDIQGGLFKTKPASKLVREANSAEGAFKKGTLFENRLAVWRPIDTGTGGAYNVPETKLQRVADIQDGIDSITVKGRVSFYVRQDLPFTTNPTLDARNRTIKWKLRAFFAQKNTTAFNFTYGSENVYKGSNETWTTGSDAYIEQDLGTLNGSLISHNIKSTGTLSTTNLTSATTTVIKTNAFFAGFLITQPFLPTGYKGYLRIQNNSAQWISVRYAGVSYDGTSYNIVIESTDFSAVNADIGNAIEVVEEKITFYQSNFELSVNNFPSNENLFFNVVLIGEDYVGNQIAFPRPEYEYLTNPSSKVFDSYDYSAEFQVLANDDISNISTFEFVTENDSNSKYSYEIILPENKILEKGEDFYGNDVNWLKIIPPDVNSGNLLFDSRIAAGENWSDAIGGTKENFLRRLNHNRLLGLTEDPYLVLETSFQGYVGFFRRISYNSKNWIFSNGVYNANLARWDAVLIQLQSTTSTTTNASTVTFRQGIGGTSGVYNDSRRLSDIGQFDYLALTDGETSGTVTTIQIRDGKSVGLPDNTQVKIYNPQTGDFDEIVLNGAWNGEADITVDSIALSATYPDGSLIILTGSDLITYIQDNFT